MRVVLLAASREARDAVGSILETRGHEVIAFADASEALERLDDDQTANAFLVIDLKNQERAIELCWEARLIASFERPIYICLVARPLPSETMVEALDCGADDVLQLPLSPDELYARLRSAERMNQMQLKLVEMATRDGLTGLLNRPAFFNRTTRICRETEASLAAIMVDIDHFKAVNDRYGHAAGDKALQSIAGCLSEEGAVAARLGGEEFVLLLPETSADRAWRRAEDLRRLIARRDIEFDGAALRVSCSFGVAVAGPGVDIDDLLRRADAALYDAKRNGRNRVMLHVNKMSDAGPAPPFRRSRVHHAGDRAACRQFAG